MKAVLFTVAALLGSTVASIQEHHIRLHEKEDYPVSEEPSTTEIQASTQNDTWYGEAAQAPLVPESSSSSAHVASSPASGVATSVAISSTSSNSASTAPIGAGTRWAITYSAYEGTSATDGSCKSALQVMEDVSQIAAKGFSTVRIYATDCHHLKNVGSACRRYGLRMIPGIFIGSGGIDSDAYDQLNDITEYFDGDYSIVEAIVLGNEAIFNHFATGDELATFLASSKTTLRINGYFGPVTTTDTVAAIQANVGVLCDVLDVVGANIHPFFNGWVQPGDSGSFIEQQMQMLAASCPGKEVYNYETGWPSAGPDHMNAVASPDNQAAALSSIASSSVASRSVFFSFEDEGWKYDGTYSVEPHWGCAQAFAD